MTAMPDVLRKICDVKRGEIDELRTRDRDRLRRQAEHQPPPRGFRDALTASDRLSLIAEIKKGSPSAGIIREEFDPAAIARSYAEGGAACLSVLTDAPFFCGHLEHLQQAREAADLPALRKDFILDEVQVTESRAAGADCVLLIAAVLERDALARLLAACRKWKMDALVEVHDERELGLALEAGADMVGVNNRDLRTFEVDLEVSRRLADRIPHQVVAVSESGIGGREDARRVHSWGYDAVLVGEHLMRQDDPAAAAAELAGT